MRCNILMTNFVKKTLKKAHETLVGRLMVKAQLAEAAANNDRLSEMSTTYAASSQGSPSISNGYAASAHSDGSPGFPPQGLYHDPLTLRAQSPFNPGRFSSYQTLDNRQSIQAFPSPNNQVDQAYQNANPYYQQQIQDPRASYLQSDFGSSETLQQQMQRTSYQPSELAASGYEPSVPSSGPRNGTKRNAGPPAHQVFAPVELPAHVPR